LFIVSDIRESDWLLFNASDIRERVIDCCLMPVI
jgi:predicted RNase H-like nuclease